MYKTFGLGLTFLLIFALGLGYFFWRRESHKSAFEKIDEALAVKIAPEVRDWFKKNPSGTARLLVYFDVGKELKGVEYPYEDDEKLCTIAWRIRKKENAIKRGESVDLAELERDKIALAEIERGIPEKLQAIRRKMFAYNCALIKPIWDQVVAQLQAIKPVFRTFLI